MSVKFNNGNYVLSNTCSFDTIVQMLAVAYCDSTAYTKYVKEKKRGKYIVAINILFTS